MPSSISATTAWWQGDLEPDAHPRSRPSRFAGSNDPAAVQRDDPPGGKDGLGSVRHDDAGQRHRPSASLTARSRATSRWLVASSSSRSRGRCRARAPAGRAASARPRALRPCRRSACRSPSASRRCRRGPPRAGRSPRSQARSGAGAKKAMLSAIDPAKSLSSCITTPIISRQRVGPEPSSGSPLTRISPRVGASRPARSLSERRLAAARGPAMATHSPASMRKLTSAEHQGSFGP